MSPRQPGPQFKIPHPTNHLWKRLAQKKITYDAVNLVVNTDHDPEYDPHRDSYAFKGLCAQGLLVVRVPRESYDRGQLVIKTAYFEWKHPGV